jgi:ketosteroid isomerase-like protein
MKSASETVVREYYDAVDRGDLERILELFAPDATYDRPGYDTIRGREQLRHFYSSERILEGGRHSLEVVVSNGDCVSCFGRYIGCTRSKTAVDIRFADIHRVVAEHIAERRTYFFTPAV